LSGFCAACSAVLSTAWILRRHVREARGRGERSRLSGGDRGAAAPSWDVYPSVGNFDEPFASSRRPPQGRQREIFRVAEVPEPSALTSQRLAHIRVGIAQRLQQREADRPATNALPGCGILPHPKDMRPRRSSHHVLTSLRVAVRAIGFLSGWAVP